MGVQEAILRHLDCVAGHDTPQRTATTAKTGHTYDLTCSVLTTASDVTEIDEIAVVGVATSHQWFKIIVAS